MSSTDKPRRQSGAGAFWRALRLPDIGVLTIQDDMVVLNQGRQATKETTMKVRITTRKYGQIVRHTVTATFAARLVANLIGMGFEILSVEA